MSIKKWDGWEKLSRKDLGMDPVSRHEKKISPFVIGQDKRLSSKNIVGNVLIKNEHPVSSISKKAPLLCECCGYSIPSNDFFYFFNPSKKLICRGCRQNNKKCLNCREVISPNLFFEDVPYCQDCKKKGYCDACGKETPNANLERIQKTKGCYCQHCAKNARSCLHCFRKLPDSASYVCQFCSSNEIHTKEEIISFIEEVVNFYRSLDSSFYIPLRSKSLNLIDLKDIGKNLVLIEKPIAILNGGIVALNTIKEINVHRHLSYDLSQNHVQHLGLFRENNAMKKTLITFLCYLYFDQKKLISPIEDIQELGLLQGKAFSFFKDTYEKVGLLEVYRRIKGAPHG